MISDRTPYSFRQDGNVPGFADARSSCVMEEYCALYAQGAAWIARNVRYHAFRIIPLQSDLGRASMCHFGMDSDDPTSWLYLQDGHAFSSMDALIRVGQRLGCIWQGLTALHIIPKASRDRLYRLVAYNRYRCFGRADLCSMPDQLVQERILR